MLKSIKLREDGIIVAEFSPAENPKVSSSGKTRILAGTGGFIKTDLDIEGLGVVSINANLTVENPDYVKPADPVVPQGPVPRAPGETPPPAARPVLRAAKR